MTEQHPEIDDILTIRDLAGTMRDAWASWPPSPRGDRIVHALDEIDRHAEDVEFALHDEYQIPRE